MSENTEAASLPTSEPFATSAVSPTSAKGRAIEIRKRFQDLARQWREETCLISSTTDMAMHPAYQQIIGMGQEALSLIFEEMRRQPGHWFWALQAITGENPVPTSERGQVPKMTQAWLEWARQHGI